MNKPTLVIVVAAFALLASGTAFAQQSTGNGATSGPRFTLNIIAYDRCPGGDGVGSQGHRIAVQADYMFGTNPSGSLVSSITRVNDIMLSPSPDADPHVVDAIACDSNGAHFQLPANPYTCPALDPNCLNTDPTFQAYKVYLRLVGKPWGSIDVRSCATDTLDTADTTDDVIVCSTESIVETRFVGKNYKPQFQDYTKQLLTLCLDTDLSGTCDTRLAVFDPSLQDYFWNWNTQGRPHAQLFFIMLPD